MPNRFLLFAISLVVPAATTAGPRDDLLHLVPDDYTFCVVVQDLRHQAKGAGKSSLFKDLADSPILAGFRSTPEAVKFQAAMDGILQELDLTAGQVRDDLLGDALVFAYRKGPPGQEGREDGLILLHARDGDLLRRVVDRVNALQIKSGEVRGVEAVGEGDRRYFRRVKMVDAEPPDFYAIDGNRLVFSGSESLVRGAVPRLAAVSTKQPAVAQRMTRLGVSEAAVCVLINPRSFDAEVAASAGTGKPSERAFLKEFGRYWRAVDGLALFLDGGTTLELGLAVSVKSADLSGDAARLFSEAGKRSPLWSRIPDDALFAVVGRIHLESLAATLGRFLTGPDRASVLEAFTDASRPFLETDDYGALARGLGPDAGFWVTAPAAGAKSWVPSAFMAVKVADGPDGKLAGDAAIRGLDFLARLASLQHKGLRVHTEMQGSVEVRSLHHPTAFPPGFRPAFGRKGGYILLADSPATWRQFEPPTDSPAAASEVPILRLSVSGWRKYLAEHRQPMLSYLAGLKGTDPKEVGQHLDAMLPLLAGIDRMEIVHRSGPDRATIVLRVREVRQ
jgi:hypothetical protein